MSEKPRLLFHSNAPWAPTGYGQQCGLFAPHLNKHFDLAISSFYGLEGARLNWDTIPVLPGVGGTYGNETIQPHAMSWLGDLRGGLTVTLMDVWVLEPEVFQKLNTVCWVPVDHEPAPPFVRAFLQDSGAVPMAMSRFGQEQLEDFDALYCPHAVDTEIFKAWDRDKMRHELNLSSDVFVVGMVAANKGNPSRKSFSEVYQAFAALQQRHDDVLLYVHTEPTGSQSGVNLHQLAHELKIPPKAIRYPNQYRYLYHPFPDQTLAGLYSAMDVLVNPAAGEGFGIPVLEAQACGVPAIVSSFSAMPEVCGAGWGVDGTRVYTPQMAWQVRPDVEQVLEYMEQARALSDGRKRSLAEQARQHAEKYDVRRVMDEHMLPALEEATERFADREPVAVAA